MANSSGDVVAFDLSTTTATPNGFFDQQPERPVNGEDGAGAEAEAGGGGDSLICDTNNNELSKLGCSGILNSLAQDESSSLLDQQFALLNNTTISSIASAMQGIKDHHSSGDKSIDSGVAGGDSDEADCAAVATPSPSPPAAEVTVAAIQSVVISRPNSCTGEGSSSNSSLIGSSGDEFKCERSPLPLSPVENLLQDQFFMNGIERAMTDDDEEEEEENERQLQQKEEEEEEVENAMDDDDISEHDVCGQSNSVLGGSLEEENSLQHGKGFAQDCKICQNTLSSPRVLSCLHVFCESCLDNALLSRSGQLSCPVCHQRTQIGHGGVSSLHVDYVLTNILDLSSIDLSALACTSCKSKDVAISRCNDCANILCASCDNAHQYMRCFEKHHVVRLQELLEKSSASETAVAIHKPLFCTVHATENLKYYCQHCQVPVCNECLIGDHKGGEHCYEVIGEAELTARIELERLQRESKAQVEHCNEAQVDLDSALMELQSQHDSARASIEESYQSFKAVLEKCRDNALKQLDALHSERELKVMEVMHDVEKCTEKIECAGRFTERALNACNGPELLSLKGLIARQFTHLQRHIPRSQVNYAIEFESQFEQFDLLAQETFGRFRTERSQAAISPKETTPPPTLPGMPPILVNHQGHHQQNQHHHHQSQSHGHQHQQLQGRNMHLQVNLSNNGNNNQNTPRQLMSMGSVGGQQSGNNSSMMGISAFNGTVTSQGGNTLSNSVTASSPISLPPSMQSSFDGDMSSALSGSQSSSGNNTQPPSSASTTGSISSFGALMDHHQVGERGLPQGPPPVIPPMNVPPPSLVGGGPGGLSSIAEYNIQQLANLVEQSSSSVVLPQGSDMTDSILPTSVSVPPPNGQGSITLNDILSIDPHALQAWSKMGGLNQQASALLSRGPSPGVDNLMLNDFSTMAPNSDDMMLNNFNAAAVAAGVGPSVVQNGGGGGSGGGGGIGGIGSGQQGLAQGGIGVPGRTKSTAMQIRCKFGSLGPSKGQFNSPHGFCLGVDEEIVVADTNNHRIEVFEKSGTFKFQFGVPGKDEGQLWYPRKVAVMRPSSKFVVCDRGNERSRMQIFNKAGHFMKKIAIRYIDIVAGLAVTNQGHIVAVDSVSPTVFIISEEGDLVHWFDCSDYMREPSDIAINGNDFYVCDFKGHCVAVFSDDGTFKYRIGNEKITCFPNGIDISDAGDILIGDSHGNRFHVACFSRDGVLQSEYECPYVKVSRCCGLKITSEGFVVTLAKNNHHVLVLNTLYIQ